MLVFKKIFQWLMLSLLFLSLLGVVYITYFWSQHTCVETGIRKTLPNDRKSIIAVFGPDTPRLSKIRVDRFLFKEPFRYPFYSPQFYSDYFRIDLPFNDSLVYVVDEKDTVKWADLYLLDTVPSRIKGYDYSGMLSVTYYQDTLFMSNIKYKPTVSIVQQISFGPTECK